MEYKVIAIGILLIGLFVLFSKQMIKMTLLSFLITVLLFIVLVANGHYLLALGYITIDSLIKFEFFLFLTNKDLKSKPPVFKQSRLIKKITSSFLIVILSGISFVYYDNKHSEKLPVEINSLEVLTISCIVTIFLISGYIIKSNKWKQ